MNRPPDSDVSPEAMEFLDTTLFLDQISIVHKLLALPISLIFHPLRTARCLFTFVTATPMQSFRDYQRLGYHLMEACYLSRRLKRDAPDHIHCHFVNGATSIGMFLAELIAVPFSFTMHASIIWIDPIALQNKLRRCIYCVSISDYNRKYVAKTFGQKWHKKINIIHCGIRPSGVGISSQSAIAERRSVSVLAVGQLTKRKGYHVLLEAAKLLREHEIRISWTIVGDGEQRKILETFIEKYDLYETVNLVGSQPHEKIPDFLRDADIFTLPCVIGNDSSRDGIPVALMEAMAWRLPVVSTNIVGLPELIDSGSDGILVEPDNPQALANAILKLAESPEQRTRIGAAAAAKVEREFNSLKSAQQLAALFDQQTTS